MNKHLPLPKQQVPKNRAASFVDASNLAIEHGVFNLQIFRDPRGQLSESMKDIRISGDKLALARIEMKQRAETINLQLENLLI
jgi:hypothetical protein